MTKRIPKTCEECIAVFNERMNERFADMREYLYSMIHKEIIDAKLHAGSSQETLKRFAQNEENIRELARKFESFLEKFSSHISVREGQMLNVLEKINDIGGKLDGHITSESETLAKMHENLEKITPFVNEATRAKIAEEYLAEKEASAAKKWKSRTGWAERILWIIGGIAALGSLYLMALQIFGGK